MSYEVAIEHRFFIKGIALDQPIEYAENLTDALNIAAMFKKIHPEFKRHSIVVREFNPLTREVGEIVERF